MTYYNYDANKMFTGESETPTQNYTTVAPPSHDGYFVWKQDHWECLLGVDSMGMISSKKELVVFVPPTHPTDSGQYWDFTTSTWVNLADRHNRIGKPENNLDRDLEITYTNGAMTRASFGLLSLTPERKFALTKLIQSFPTFFMTTNIRDLSVFGYDSVKNIVTAYTMDLPLTDPRLVSFKTSLGIDTLANFIGYKFDLGTKLSFAKVFDMNTANYAGPTLPAGALLIAKGINVGPAIDPDIDEIYFVVPERPALEAWCVANSVSYSTEMLDNAHKWLSTRYSIKYNKNTLAITEFKQYLFNSFYTINQSLVWPFEGAALVDYRAHVNNFEEFAATLGI